jgi:hypothetical protein
VIDGLVHELMCSCMHDSCIVTCLLFNVFESLFVPGFIEEIITGFSFEGIPASSLAVPCKLHSRHIVQRAEVLNRESTRGRLV